MIHGQKNIKIKGKVYPKTGREAPEEE